MSLDTLLAKRLGRPASTPPAPPKIQSAEAPTVDVVKPAAERATLAELIARHGDASGGGIAWSAWALASAAASDSWLVLTAHGATLLRTAAPVSKPRSYCNAWPLKRIAPWPDSSDDDSEEFAERAAILEFDAGLARAEAERIAVELIERARCCWGCRNLRAARGATDRLPCCEREHRLVWRTTATRTWPGRLDARACGDRQAGGD